MEESLKVLVQEKIEIEGMLKSKKDVIAERKFMIAELRHLIQKKRQQRLDIIDKTNNIGTDAEILRQSTDSYLSRFYS
jgi:hypothetical protein